jgi:hypothetical protein
MKIIRILFALVLLLTFRSHSLCQDRGKLEVTDFLVETSVTRITVDSIGRIENRSRSEQVFALSPLARMFYKSAPDICAIELSKEQTGSLEKLLEKVNQNWKKREFEELNRVMASLDSDILKILTKEQQDQCRIVLSLRDFYLNGPLIFVKNYGASREEIIAHSKVVSEKLKQELIDLEFEAFVGILEIADKEKAKKFRDKCQSITPLRTPAISPTWLELVALSNDEKLTDTTAKRKSFRLGYSNTFVSDRTEYPVMTFQAIRDLVEAQNWDFAGDRSMNLFLLHKSNEYLALELESAAEVEKVREEMLDSLISKAQFDKIREELVNNKMKRIANFAKEIEESLNESEQDQIQHAKMFNLCQRDGAISAFRSELAKKLGFQISQAEVALIKEKAPQLRSQLEKKGNELQKWYFESLFSELESESLEKEFGWVVKSDQKVFPPLELLHQRLSVLSIRKLPNADR